MVWDSNPDKLRAGEISFPEGSDYRTALGRVVDSFNNNPSNYNIELTYDEARVSRMGTQSEIWFSSDFDAHWGYAAMTWIKDNCNHIYAVDIVFNVNEVWSPGIEQDDFDVYGGEKASFRAVLMHEMGHVLGLGHEGNEYNLMGYPREHMHTNCSRAYAYLGEDVADGAVSLYGADASAGEDVSVVHWKFLRTMEFVHDGRQLDFSDHTRTRILPVSSPIIFFGEGGELVYLIRNGDTIDVEFTFENNGANRQENVHVGFYLSDNDCITAWNDRRIGGITVDLERDRVFTTTQQITLPDNLEGSRYYYIGAVIDETRDLAEFNEANNATYVAKFMINPVPVDNE